MTTHAAEDKRVGFAGLGTMGMPMVRRLLDAGFEVTVWNRSQGPVDELAAEGAKPVGDLAEVFAQPVVLSILADDTSVRERILQDDLLAGAKCEVHVNLATISAALADEAATLHARYGIGYVAAPVIGRAEVAAAGGLNVLSAGADQDLARVAPYLEPLAGRVWTFGETPSQANVVKIAVNFLLGAAINATAEAAALVEAYNVDAGDLIELISSSLFPGPVYKTYGGLMVSGQYEPAGFTTLLGLKDTRLALDAAHSRSLSLPTANLVQQGLVEAVALGWGERDWATLGDVARRHAGQTGSAS